MRLYVATSNPGKLRDFSYAARAFPGVEILPLPGLADIPAPIEDAPTFEGNATLKARAYGALLPDEIVVADDSGLTVPSLGGEPGVRSARYAEDKGFTHPGTLDERNLACLISNILHQPERHAHYTCVLAAARAGSILATGTGNVHGEILLTPRGSAGFGYDPVFLLPTLNQTMAEVTPATRLQVSHRGRALVDLLHRLKSQSETSAR